MDYHVEFQVRQDSDGRPNDCSQDEELSLNEPTWIPAPDDTIDLMYGGHMRCFMVLTRHFSYSGKSDLYHVNVVVREATDEERNARVSE